MVPNFSTTCSKFRRRDRRRYSGSGLDRSRWAEPADASATIRLRQRTRDRQRILSTALREGYHTALMRGQFPVTFLFLDLDPA